MQPGILQSSTGAAFSEFDVPQNISTGSTHQYQQHHPQHGMPSVPEDFNNANFNNYADTVAPYFPVAANQYYENNYGNATRNPVDRNSLLHSTGSDGLPRFGQGEVDLLMKGLEMAEQQQQQDQEQRQYHQQQQRFG
jgi:hypothetical protein